MVNLKEIRENMGFTKKEFSKKLEIPYTTYLDWENGNHLPPKWAVNLIIKVLKLEYGYEYENEKDIIE